jgi:hypothetical protein
MKQILFIAMVLLMTATLRAEHFIIELTVKSAQEEATAHADTDPPAQGTHPRPLVHAKKGEPLVFQFFFTSNFPHNVLKRVQVRYYVTPEKEAGNKSPPAPGKAPVIEGSFVLDFKPETGRVGMRQRLRIDQPGTYIVRAESDHSDSDHEHFAALDLVVE